MEILGLRVSKVERQRIPVVDIDELDVMQSEVDSLEMSDVMTAGRVPAEH